MGKRIAKIKKWETTKFTQSNDKSMGTLLLLDNYSNESCRKKINISFNFLNVFMFCLLDLLVASSPSSLSWIHIILLVDVQTRR